MELWRVRKEYRQLAVKLRKSARPLSPGVQEAEAEVLLVLCSGERLQTELAVLNHTRRSARARLRRVRVLMEGCGILKDHATSALVRRLDSLAGLELHAVLTRRGFQELAATLQQLRGELHHLDRRIADVAARLERLSRLSRTSFERLLRSLKATGDEHEPREWPAR